MKIETFFENFEYLTDAPNAAAKLREIVLQLGFSGKLTRHEPKDDEVNDLLKKIKLERAVLLKGTGFREPQTLKATVQSRETLFDIPDHWVWSRIGHIFLISSGTTPNRLNHSYFESGTEYWVKTTDLNNSIVTSCEEKITKQAVTDCNLKYYPPNTVCVALYGGAGTIGKSGLLGVETTINQSVCGIYPNKNIEPHYLHSYLKLIRPLWMNFAASLRKAPNINAGVVNNMVIPIPPLAEQQRIVTKVDSLLALCDTLEAKLKATQDSKATLMEVAARQVLVA
jgi:type I restriction enzyme, S subunit